MTLLATKYHKAKNWSQRLPVAREIMGEVHEEELAKLNQQPFNPFQPDDDIEGEYSGEER